MPRRDVPHSPYLDGVGIRANEEYAIVADTHPQFVSPLHSFHVTCAGLSKSVEWRENVHRDRFADAADIVLGKVGPDNPLHFGS